MTIDVLELQELALRVRTIRAAADEIERTLTPERPGQEGGGA